MRKGIAKSSDPAPLNRQLSTAGLDAGFLEVASVYY